MFLRVLLEKRGWNAGFRAQEVDVAIKRRTWWPTSSHPSSWEGSVPGSVRGFKHGTQTAHGLETKQSSSAIWRVFRECVP